MGLGLDELAALATGAGTGPLVPLPGVEPLRVVEVTLGETAGRAGPAGRQGVLALTDRTTEAQQGAALGVLGEATFVVRKDQVDVLHALADAIDGDQTIEQVMAGVLHPDDLVEAMEVLGGLAERPGERDDRCYRIRLPGGSGDDWWLADIVGVHVPGPPLDGTLLQVRLLEPTEPLTTSRLAGLSLADAAPVALLVCDAQGGVLYANAGAHAALGIEGASRGSTWLAAVDATARQVVHERVALASAAGEAPELVVPVTPEHGRTRHLRLRFGTASEPRPARAVLVVIEDVSTLVEAQSVRDRLAHMLDMPSDLYVSVAASDGQSLYRNAPLDALMDGRSTILEVIRDGDPVALMLEMWEALETSGTWQGEVTVGTEAREIIVSAVAHAERDEDGQITAYLLAGHVITTLKETEADLRRVANHDPLTGLANRAMMRTVLDEWRNDPATREVVALYCDLNGFKEVNDRAGHAVGDAVLVEVAHRLRAEMQSADLLVRLGGDEFTLLRRNATSAEVSTLVERVEAAVSRPIEVDGHTHQVGVAIGVAWADADELDESLTLRADAAMYEDKQRRRRSTDR